MLTGWLLLTVIVLVSVWRMVAAFPLAGVGNILTFSPAAVVVSAAPRPVMDAIVLAPAPMRSCRLDVAVMVASRGTLTVRAVSPSQIQLSWAGGPTAPGRDNCQGGDIQVTAQAYERLLATQAPRPGPLGRG